MMKNKSSKSFFIVHQRFLRIWHHSRVQESPGTSSCVSWKILQNSTANGFKISTRNSKRWKHLTTFIGRKFCNFRTFAKVYTNKSVLLRSIVKYLFKNTEKLIKNFKVFFVHSTTSGIIKRMRFRKFFVSLLIYSKFNFRNRGWIIMSIFFNFISF